MSTFANVDNTSVQKRNNEHEATGSSTSNKKLRIDVSSNSTWILNSASDQSLNVNATKTQIISKSQVSAPPAENQGLKDIMTQELSDDIVIVKNASKEDCKEKKSSSLTPPQLENHEYVVLSSSIMNSIEGNEYLLSTSNTSTTLDALSNTTNVKDASVSNISIKSSDLLDITSERTENKNNTESVEVVLVPAEEESNKCDAVQSNTNTNRQPDSGKCTAKITSTSKNCLTINNDVSIGAGTSNKLHTTPTMMNRVNVQQNLQNKPVMVSTKKFMQDVMQTTTAKVSIGNTTISVPLLKPLNSKQLLNSSFSIDSQNKPSSIKYQQTVTQPKAQLNLSKILNIKRNQKGGVNHPTIVSLSQLQIKPVSTAKIVQAKVLSKKMPLQLQVSSSMPTSIQSAISNASVTQISTKNKQNIMRNIITTNIGPASIQNISTVDSEKNLNIGDTDSSRSSTAETSTPQATGETIQKSVGTIIKSSISLSAINPEKPKCVTTLKKITSSEVSTPPLLTPLGGKYSVEQKSQQQTIGISSSVSIVKQNAPQTMITTSALNTAICSTTTVSECNTRTDMLTTKQAIVRNKTNCKINTPIITFPKNISLMLAKTTVPQQSKTTTGNKSDTSICVLNSKMENSKSSNICISNIKSIPDMQTHHNAGVTVTATESIMLTPSNNDNSSDVQDQTTSTQNKALKMVNSQIAISEQPIVKRLKLSDDNEEEYASSVSATIQINAKRHSLKIAAKVTTSGNNRTECEVDNADDIEKMPTKHSSSESATRQPTVMDGDKITNQPLSTSHHGNNSTNATTITTPAKTEETHNVLLKQLLQNCPTIPSTNQAMGNNTAPNITNADNGGGGICNQVLPNRKVTNLRAPSLGLVSSLEAQLARPVIPPVPAGTTAIHRQNDKQEKVLIFVPSDCNSSSKIATNTNQNSNKPSDSNKDSTLPSKDTKLKSPTHIISKETSFVSNPNGLFSGTHEVVSVNVNTINTTKVNSNSEKQQPDTTTTKKEIFTNIQTEGATDSKTNRSNFKEGTFEITSEASPTPSTTKGFSYNACVMQPTKNIPVGIDIARKEKPSKQAANDEENSIAPPTVKINRTVLIDKNDTHAILKVEEEKPKKDVSVKQNNNNAVVFGGATTIPAPSTELSQADVHESNVGIGETAFCVGSEKTGHTVVKDVDLRKKRKREYQKQRRQMLNNNKELVQTSVTVTGAPCITTNTKRRPRKISKIEEDYDSFIDNLMIRMRQMQPLEVQEPLLNKNISFGYDKQITTRPVSNKDYDSAWKDPLYLGEYGCVNHALHNGIYDIKRIDTLDYAGQNILAIQNDFYDQEFVPVMYKNETDKLTKFIGVIRERNVEVLNIVNEKLPENTDNMAYKGQKFRNIVSQMSYPGLIITNKSSNENLGRMSPIVQIVKPSPKKRNVSANILPTFTRNCLTNIKVEGKMDDIIDSKYSKSKTYNTNDSTVVVSLHLLSSENVLSILRDLANILNISPLTNYKLLEHNTDIKPSLTNTVDNIQKQKSKKEYTYSNLQQIICGKRKVCSACGDVIHSMGIRLPSANASKLKLVQRSQSVHSRLRNNTYFCTMNCYKQFKLNTENISNKKVEEITENVKKSPQQADKEKPNPPSDNNNTRKSCFKYFSTENLKPTVPIKNNTDKDLMDMLLRLDITVTARNSLPRLKGNQASKAEEDTRQCVLCSLRGDGLSDGASRLLNFEVDKWVHLNCALWSNGVYETVSGGLMNLQTALHLGMNQTCCACHTLGATIKCFKNRCGAVYHLPCAIKNMCVFYKNKTIQCAQHASRTEKENELTSLTVHRRVFVERDENGQVAAVMHHHTEQNNLLRVGSLTFLNVGQLLPHQLEAFHTSNYIYPIGYKIIRLYWSMKRPNKRCRYLCSIAEVAGRPEFRIQVQEPSENEIELRDLTPNAVWQRILEKISILRKENDMVQLFPKFITGEDLFGLTEPTIVRIIESLPGIENLTDYRFKYGRNPLLELPLAVNPSGSARTEPKQRQLLGWRKPHTQRSATTFNQRTTNSSSTIAGEVACPYSKQFVHSKSSQYKKMKQEWRNNVYLARSKIQGLGLYAARDIEKHTMIIEYIGEVIRTEVSEIREKQYESKNRGIYMFRLDEDRVVDATLSGGLARYINHSCNPNCVTETVEVDRELRIIIFAKRRIIRSEELSYDYKFDIEDDAHKIPCMCGTPNCRKWMN